MTRREPRGRRQLRWALTFMAGGGVVAYAVAVPAGAWPLAAFAVAAAASGLSIRRMPYPPMAVEGGVGAALAVGLALELWRTGSLVLAAGSLLAVVQGLLAPRASGRLHRWAVAGGIVGHLLAGSLWPMRGGAVTGYLGVVGLLGVGAAWTLALAHRVETARQWRDTQAEGAAGRLEAAGAGRGSLTGAAWITAAALFLSAGTFVLVPRPGLSAAPWRSPWGPGGGIAGTPLPGAGGARERAGGPGPLDDPGDAHTGFRDRVEFDDMGTLKQDIAVALRVSCFDEDVRVRPTGDLLLRGIALNHYADHRWSAVDVPTKAFADADDGRRDGRTALARPAPGATHWRQHIEPVNCEAPYVFHCGRLLAASFPRLVYDANGTAALEAPATDPYDAWGQVSLPDGAALQAAGVTPDPAFVQIPWRSRRTLDLLARIRRELAGNETNPYRLARLLQAGLRTRYHYSLAVPKPAPGAEPLADFIRGRSPGHCEYFASTMILLLRTANVPCRLVGGFRTGEYDARFGVFIVRARDAHAWVEVRFDGVGWVPFDPTPADTAAEGPVQITPVDAPADEPAPDVGLEDAAPGLGDRVLAFDAEERATLLAYTGGLWGLLLAIGVVGLLGLLGLRSWQRLAPEAEDDAPDPDAATAAARWRRAPPGFYAALLRALAAAGFHRRPAHTPRELARDVRRARGPAPKAVARVTRAFEALRYGRRALTPETEAKLRDLVDEVAVAARSG